MPRDKSAGFAVQMKDFFGFRDGDTYKEFMAEIKALTPKDKEDFTKMLEGAGYPVTKVS